MRTSYQASPWQAATAAPARALALGLHTPTRLGTPSRFFVGESFSPAGGAIDRSLIVVNERVTLPDGSRPIEGVHITRPVCRCKFGHLKRDPAMLGQGCSQPTAGGSGSATYDGGTPESGTDLGTIALAAGAGVAALFILGIL